MLFGCILGNQIIMSVYDLKPFCGLPNKTANSGKFCILSQIVNIDEIITRLANIQQKTTTPAKIHNPHWIICVLNLTEIIEINFSLGGSVSEWLLYPHHRPGHTPATWTPEVCLVKSASITHKSQFNKTTKLSQKFSIFLRNDRSS